MDAILEPGGVWVFSEVWARVDGSTSSLSLLKCFCPPSPTGEIPSHLREFAEAAASLILAFDEDVPGRAMSSGNAEWLSNLEHAPLETFKRPVQARTAGLKTAFGVPIQYDGPNFSNCCMVLCVYSDQTLQYDDQLLENLLRIFKERRELAALRDLSNSYPAPKDLLPPTHSQFLSLPLMSSFSDMDVLHGMDLPNLVWPNSSTPSIASPASHPTTTNHSPYRLSPVASDSLSFTTTTTSPIGPSLNLKLELDDILVDPTTSNSNSNSKAGDPFLKAIYDLTFKHDLMMTPLAPQQLQHSQQQQQHQQQQQQHQQPPTMTVVTNRPMLHDTGMRRNSSPSPLNQHMMGQNQKTTTPLSNFINNNNFNNNNSNFTNNNFINNNNFNFSSSSSSSSVATSPAQSNAGFASPKQQLQQQQKLSSPPVTIHSYQGGAGGATNQQQSNNNANVPRHMTGQTRRPASAPSLIPAHMTSELRHMSSELRQSATGSPDSFAAANESAEDDWADDMDAAGGEQATSPMMTSSATDQPMSRPRPDLLTHADLAKHFNKKANEASRALGVSLTTLKKTCRRLGITRWPFRKVQMVGRNLAKVRQLMSSTLPPKTSSSVLNVLEGNGTITPGTINESDLAPL
mmetsp:Transcript_10031/g.16470  ORF Transcript_10031/g.16470 Transcript_10031/m.16470 type:complete len:630 (+) Transcript_10031:267-2156(+)|eukprot:CAMPEP_0184650776 /NCGR_PEP_ID=MMETSP0308-20130426/8341_1 /TAXON_ID=38269 /ORGANISM="Gloeochaete witrockiana, Strain SAG 46.84" /LENGTH=629 /DNA_ID=CAMNT_0027084553 /DNA_START=219 /DNA_END=2111 /DNA_ORIENTATION=+